MDSGFYTASREEGWLEQWEQDKEIIAAWYAQPEYVENDQLPSYVAKIQIMLELGYTEDQYNEMSLVTRRELMTFLSGRALGQQNAQKLSNLHQQWDADFRKRGL